MSHSKLFVKQRINELFRKEHYHERKRDHLMALKRMLLLPNFNQVKECLPNFLPEHSKFIIDECQPCHREQVHEFVLNAFSEQDDKDEIIRFINFDIEQVLPCLSPLLTEHWEVVLDETPSRHRKRVENFVISAFPAQEDKDRIMSYIRMPLTTTSHSMQERVRDRFLEKTSFSSPQPAVRVIAFLTHGMRCAQDDTSDGTRHNKSHTNNSPEIGPHQVSCEVNPIDESSPLMEEHA
eukprot:PhF_6_TR23801/c1_g2_i2/m.33321